MRYFAIEGSSLSLKGAWVTNLLNGNAPQELPEFKNQKGLLFSNITLDKFIEEEYRHDAFNLSEDKKRSISTYSSGEQKKALLEYLIQQQPDFLILDNPFDCLDAQSVAALKSRLNQLALNLPMLQIFKRQDDLLPFISHVLLIADEKFQHCYTKEDYLGKNLHQKSAFLETEIPVSPHSYEEIPDILIEMKDVKVSYHEKTILRNINWRIGKGEFWQLSGPNGSGKTTLLSMIYGNNPKAFGQDIYLFGKKKGSGESVWELKEKMGYFSPAMTELFQRSNTVEQMVISGLLDTVGLYRKATGRQKEIARQWLTAIELLSVAQQTFTRLSQVHQRMVLIARAMVKHPPLLILDEPATGLDDAHASLLTQLINKIARESQTSILYVSHRKEPGLKPNFTFQLTTHPDGSTGKIV